MNSIEPDDDPLPTGHDVAPSCPEVIASGQLPTSLGILPDALEETMIATAVRLLRDANAQHPPSPVEAAILRGAGEMFQELSAACYRIANDQPRQKPRQPKRAKGRASGGLQ